MNEQDAAYQGYAYAPPVTLPSERADLLDKIQPSIIVTEVFHRLLGEIEINGIWKKDPRLSTNNLSTLGAWEISTLMLSVSSKNVSLSKLKDSEIRARTLAIAKSVQKMAIRCWKEYNITNIAQLNFIHEIVFSNSFITLKQPEGEGIRKLLQNTMTGEIAPAMPEEQQPGFFKSIFRRG